MSHVPAVPDIKRRPLSLVLSVLALLAIVPLLAYSVIQLEGPRIQRKAMADLAAIGELKAHQIETWLGERRDDAEMLMIEPGLADDAASWLDRRDPAAQARLARRQASLGHAFSRWELLDARAQPETSVRRSLLSAALDLGQPLMGDLYRDGSGQVWLDLAVPLIQAGSGRKVGAVVLGIEANAFLFPFIQTWPTSSPSAETLLCRRDGANVLFLNQLRHSQVAPLTLRLPLGRTDLPAALAIRAGGRAQSIEGRDYRGIPVLSATRPILGTAWSLVAKVDRDEVMRPLYKLMAWVSAVSVAAAIVVAAILWRLRREHLRGQQLELLARAGERDRLLSLFYDLPFMGMAIVDSKDHWLHVNDQMCEILGYRREELLAGLTWAQITHPDDLAADLANYRRLLAGDIDGYRMEKRFLRPDGEAVAVELSVKCVRNPAGAVEHIVKTVRDISERKRLEEARAAQQRAASLLDAIAAASTEAIFAKDAQGRYLYYNNEAARSAHKRPEEVIGRDDSALYPPEQAARIKAQDREVLAAEESRSFEEVLTTADGERTFLTTKGPLRDSEGRIVGLYGISRDITERKQAEDRLRRSQEQLQLFIEHAPLSIAMFDRDMHYLAYSRHWLEDYGRGHDSLLGRDFYGIHTDIQEHWRSIHQRGLAGETLSNDADLWRLADGSERWVRWAVLPWRDGAGEIGGIILSAEDITERHRTELALNDSRARLAGIISSAMDAIITLDEDQRVCVFNPAAERMFGYTADEMAGQTIDRLIPGSLREVHRRHMRSFAEEGVTNRDMTSLGELRALRRDGSEFPIEASISKITVAGDQLFTVILRDISERRRADEALRASEERFRSLVEQAADGIFVSDARGRYLDVNSAACAMLGYGREELLCLGIADVIDAAEIPRIGPEVARFAGGEVVVSEWRFRRKDGTVFPGEVSGRQLADGRLQAIVRDISERKEAEAALRYQLDLLRGITDKATDSIFICDAEGRVNAANPEAERVFGYGTEELAGRNLHEVLHHHYPNGRPYPNGDCPLCHVYSTGETIRDHEAVFFRKDGGQVIVTCSNSAIESGGKRVGATLVLHDITAAKLAEQDLRERKDDLKRAQAVGHIGSWRLDVRRNELTWSEENHRIFGIPEGSAMTYETFLACVHPDDRAYVDRMWSAALRGEPYDIEHRLLVDGQVKWVREKAELEFGADGNLLGGFGTTQDITDTKAAEQALRVSEERFQLAAEIGRSGTWDWNVLTGEVVWSRGHYDILGYQVGEVAPGYQAWVERVHPDDRPQIEAEIGRCMQERVEYGAEFRIVWPDGSVHWMNARGRFEYDEAGACTRMVGVMADITSLKQAEIALREADQRKDEFLAMLAHELRNPLAPIRNAAHVLGRLDVAEPRVHWARDIIEGQVAHLTHLVDDLLDISRIARGKVSLRMAPVRLDDLVRQAGESVQPLMTAKQQHYQTRLPEAEVVLEGDSVRLVQVLQNLLNNAAKYTPDEGHIELSAHMRGHEVEIQVRDDGMGMSADLLGGVFDLFRQGERTLDRSQGGLGIGLTLVRRLVELHGGTVLAYSPGPGLGSTFTVRLPASEAIAAPPTPDAAKAIAPAPAPLRVLVVDDDPIVAESMLVFLELEGHLARGADCGDAAVRLVEDFRPDVVLLDIGLPGQDGYAVARRIRQLPGGADLKLIAVSGYGDQESVLRSGLAGFDRHLVKPVDPEVFSELLAKLARPV
ncbi:MAG: PAS domain S-box protein [Thiobacillus sp.]|nr:PAS domain S-box protein [Thiobacillus sp.]